MTDNRSRDLGAIREIKRFINNSEFCYENDDDDWIRWIADVKVVTDSLLEERDKDDKKNS